MPLRTMQVRCVFEHMIGSWAHDRLAVFELLALNRCSWGGVVVVEVAVDDDGNAAADEGTRLR